MQWVLFFSLLVALFYFQAGLYLLWKNPEARFNRWFFGLTVYFGFWSLSLSATYMSVFENQTAVWELIVLCGLSLLPFMLVSFFSLLIPIPDKNQQLWKRGFLIIGFLLLFVFLLEFIYLLRTGREDQYLLFELAAYLLYLMLIIAGGKLFIMLSRWQRSLQRTGERKQYQFAFYTLLLAIICMLWFDYLFPVIAESAHLKQPHVYFFPLSLGLAIGYLKYHLYAPLPSESARRLLEELEQFVFFCDAEIRVVYTNSFSSKILGRESSEIKGSNLADFFDNRDTLEALVRRGRHTGHSGPFEMHIQASGSEALPVKVYCAELSDRYGDSHGIVVYGEDMRSALALEEEVRHRVRMEEIIRNESKILEEETEKRTRELARSVCEAQYRMKERMQAEEIIKNEIAEMEVMLDEIHHRVKKNLKIFLSLIGASFEMIKIPYECNSLAALHERIRALLLVHEYVVSEVNYSNVNFRGFLSEQANRFDHLMGLKKGGVSFFAITADDITLPADQALPLGLAINELFSYLCNCHYTDHQRDSGGNLKSKIELSICWDNNDHCYLLISYPETSCSAISNERVNSCQGLQLAKMLVEEQLNGMFILERKDGFQLRISFPAFAPRQEVYHYHIH